MYSGKRLLSPVCTIPDEYASGINYLRENKIKTISDLQGHINNLRSKNSEIYMTSSEAVNIGSYMGFEMLLSFDTFNREYHLSLKHEMAHRVTLGVDAIGNITRLNNSLSDMPKKLEYQVGQLETLKQQMEDAKLEVNKPFSQEADLVFKMTRLNELNALLNVDEKETYIIDEEPEAVEEVSLKKAVGFER